MLKPSVDATPSSGSRQQWTQRRCRPRRRGVRNAVAWLPRRFGRSHWGIQHDSTVFIHLSYAAPKGV